eukprot:GEMP01047428.1.p1 GENE.GEMP01047428.1~~GEMP01047428.1.p1  ORF type:complete len:450 (-),score=145.33 GEMP01047428.1:295-1644(-)
MMNTNEAVASKASSHLTRAEFHRAFKTNNRPAVLPVIHAQTTEQVLRNIAIAMSRHAQGVFLINHDFGLRAFPILSTLQQEGTVVDAYWADEACIDERADIAGQQTALDIQRAYDGGKWRGMYFGGTCFKKQRAVSPQDYAAAAALATHFMHVVTTSGVATGEACELDKMAAFRAAIGDAPLGLASGVTPNNVDQYVKDVDVILVSTGINYPGDFYNIEPCRLSRLIARVTALAEASEVAPKVLMPDVFLGNMAPNVKGAKYAWLDPSAAYVNATSFHALVDTLVAPLLLETPFDIIAGIDAAGFVLGAALATRLHLGFLTIRKANKLPVPTTAVEFVNYTGQTQRLEMRDPGVRAGQRVVLVDQWVETGGTMRAGIELIEKQGGVIAMVVAICIEEEQPNMRLFWEEYPCVTVVQSGSALQKQCNAHSVDGFDNFDWRRILAEGGDEL